MTRMAVFSISLGRSAASLGSATFTVTFAMEDDPGRLSASPPEAKANCGLTTGKKPNPLKAYFGITIRRIASMTSTP